MKTFVKYTICVAFAGLIFMGCNKNDDPYTWSIGNANYVLTAGELINFGDYFNPNTYDYYVTLETGTVRYDEELDRYIGSGNLIQMELLSSVGALADGTYTIIDPDTLEDDNALAPYMMIFTSYVTGMVNGVVGTSFDIVSGEAVVKTVAGEYEITFSFIDENGVALSGYYKGALTYYDFR